jgi:hypothetical protein
MVANEQMQSPFSFKALIPRQSHESSRRRGSFVGSDGSQIPEIEG